MKEGEGTHDAGVIDGKPCHWSSVKKKCTNNYMWRRIGKATFSMMYIADA